jgi:hypothetical protein
MGDDPRRLIPPIFFFHSQKDSKSQGNAGSAPLAVMEGASVALLVLPASSPAGCFLRTSLPNSVTAASQIVAVSGFLRQENANQLPLSYAYSARKWGFDRAFGD